MSTQPATSIEHACLDVISYWHTSLLDAERLGLDGQVFKEETIHRAVTRAQLATGALNAQIVEWLFEKDDQDLQTAGETHPRAVGVRPDPLSPQAAREQAVGPTVAQQETEFVEVQLCPIRLIDERSGASVAPVWMPAVVSRCGQLSVGSQTPWIARRLLEPNEAYLTIGTIEAFNDYVSRAALPTDNWSKYWEYCHTMLQHVAGAGYDNLEMQGFRIAPEAYVFKGSQIPGITKHVRKLYEYMLANTVPPLAYHFTGAHLSTLCPLLDRDQQRRQALRHLGQMSGTYPLSPSQREALHHFFNCGVGEVLAINGPPGTGKTTLVQSLVASLWVECAVAASEPPVIVAASTNNQAVTNVIASFGNQEPMGGELARRWLPELLSYGLYLVSAAKPDEETKAFQCIKGSNNFFATLENEDYVRQAIPHFLDYSRRQYGQAIDSVQVAVEHLHRELKQLVECIHRLLSELLDCNGRYRQIIDLVEHMRGTLWQGSALPEPFEKLVVDTMRQIQSAEDGRKATEATYELLDTARYLAFLLTTHYWEGRWLLETQKLLQKALTGPRVARHKEEERRWRRYAKLTPCFVSTFYMLPRFFSVYEAGQDNAPLLEFLDLLVVDEAGQASPEVAGASFALARQALVVGDEQQIEPVWSIPEAIDCGNLLKHRLLSEQTQKPDFDITGRSASAGSVMRIAQCLSKYQKYPEQRGMFLSEHRRCVRQIINYCNELCYRGRLEPKTKEPTKMPVLSGEHHLTPMAYCDIHGKAQRVAGSWQNEIEAQAIVAWLVRERSALKAHYNQPIEKIVGIVTPFKVQARLIRTALRNVGILNLTVGTVHALQGAERPIVIFSSVYDALHKGSFFFDAKPNMLNVAVSRAKESFIVFGDMRIFRSQLEKASGASALPSHLLSRYLREHEGNALPGLLTQGQRSREESTIVPPTESVDSVLAEAKTDPLPKEIGTDEQPILDSESVSTHSAVWACPVCSAALEAGLSFDEDGRPTVLLRCSNREARQQPDHDGAIFTLRQIWWSARFGYLSP
ncbi:DEAD/DEAH box helicase [Gloeobacter violaceus]|uniref:DEAD/DEAH box helicase n=1 Tax=Gloeobacter violaceus TaxID=33072 RepID=UPI0013E8DAA0|nr:DEAD/DEAH box helicase [Gloeobacter violaceus]